MCEPSCQLCFFQWASKPRTGKILYALRTNDTSILLDLIYIEKDNVLQVDADIDLISSNWREHQLIVFH